MRVHILNPRGRPLRELDVATTREHQEELLDEALGESFPASDPPSPFHDIDGGNTRVERPAAQRVLMQRFLNQCLAEAIDAFNHARQAHWDLGGADFSTLHALFDDFARRLEETTDALAEDNARLFGSRAGGTELVADDAPPDAAFEAIPPGKSHVDLFSTRLLHFRETVQSAGHFARKCREHALVELLARIGRQVDRDIERLEHASQLPQRQS